MARRQKDASSAENTQTMVERDKKDSQVVDFMTPADGVFLLDTTHLDFGQSVQALLDRVAEVHAVPGGEE
jgi:cytidylate kinase